MYRQLLRILLPEKLKVLFAHTQQKCLQKVHKLKTSDLYLDQSVLATSPLKNLHKGLVAVTCCFNSNQ